MTVSRALKYKQELQRLISVGLVFAKGSAFISATCSMFYPLFMSHLIVVFHPSNPLNVRLIVNKVGTFELRLIKVGHRRSMTLILFDG